MMKLIRKAPTRRSEYTIGRNKTLTKRGNAAEHQGVETDEDLSQDDDLQAAVVRAATCKLLTIKWKFPNDEDVRTVIGMFRFNGYFLSAAVAADAVRRITRRLYESALGLSGTALSQDSEPEKPRIDIENPLQEFAANHPQFKALAELLANYLSDNRSRTYIEPGRLLHFANRERKQNAFKPLFVAEFLSELASAGILRLIYKVRPRLENSLLPQEFGSLQEIPARLDDELDRSYDREDVEVLPVFGAAA